MPEQVLKNLFKSAIVKNKLNLTFSQLIWIEQYLDETNDLVKHISTLLVSTYTPVYYRPCDNRGGCVSNY